MEDIARRLMNYEKRLSHLERLDQVFTIYAAENVINEAGRDVNFRVESSGNANMLFVDGGNDRVGIGTNTPGQLLSVQGVGMFGVPNASETLLGLSANTAGHEGVSMLHNGVEGFIDCIDAGVAFHNLNVQCATFRPRAAGVSHLGDGVFYWNDVSYKTLTDRGCLGWYEDGVELQDGSIVSDVEALKSIKKHKTLLTIAGAPRLDYSTMPKHVYKPVPIAEEDLYEEGLHGPELIHKKGEKAGEDGAELTALVSIMLGAIKELDARLEILE
jgi:prepilin-type processing-associated H-X9-DG protein